MVNLYSTGCPKCRILEAKLKQKNINYNEISDTTVLMENNIFSVPVLELDGKFYNFVEAVSFVNAYKGDEDYGYRL